MSPKILRILLVLTVMVLIACPALAEDPSELTIVFQKQKNPDQVKSAAESVAEFLGTELGMKVRVQVPSDYSSSVQALVSKTADVAYVSSLPFLLARRDGNAKLLLVEERPDAQGTPRTEYDSVLVALKDSPLKGIEDIVEQAKTLRMVFTSPTSASGYIFAYSRLVEAGLLQPGSDPKQAFKQVHFGGGYSQAVEEVLQGRADVAAVSFYVVEGPQTRKYLKPEQVERLKVVARTSGVPTHLLAVRDGLSPELQNRLKDALLKLSSERQDLLKDVYGAARLVEVREEDHVRETVLAVERIKLPIERLQ